MIVIEFMRDLLDVHICDATDTALALDWVKVILRGPM